MQVGLSEQGDALQRFEALVVERGYVLRFFEVVPPSLSKKDTNLRGSGL